MIPRLEMEGRETSETLRTDESFQTCLTGDKEMCKRGAEANWRYMWAIW